MTRLSRSKSRPPLRPRMSLFANLACDLKMKARLIIAWFWAPLKTGLESMLRFGLRSDDLVTIMERHPGDSPDARSLQPRPRDNNGRERASAVPAQIYAERLRKRFLAARHGDE